MATSNLGRFVWHELNTTDPAAGERFYRAITGWGMVSFEPDPSYRMWTAEGVPQGGLMRLPEQARKMGAPSHWLTYIGVPDVDASVRQAISLGGRTLVPPQNIPGAGRFAVLADPQSAVFAVHSSVGQMGAPEAGPKVGEFSWHELATTDPQAAWRFYQALFGWTAKDTMQTPMGPYQMFGRGSFTYGGIYTKPEASPAPPNWLAYIKVRSVDAASAKATSLGAKILAGPMDVPGGDRVVMCMDPQGAAFALHSQATAAPRAGNGATRRTAKIGSKPTGKRKRGGQAKPKKKASARTRKKRSAARKTIKKRATQPARKTRRAAKKKAKPKAKAKAKARKRAHTPPRAR